MLDNVAGYAVDKAKFWLDLTPEEATTYRMAWREVFGSEEGPQGGKVYNIVSVKKGNKPNSFFFAFDVWGEASAKIDALDFEMWYPHLDRLDLKTTMPMTVDGQKNYLDYLEEKIGDKRNFGWLNSKARQKRGKRDAGGHGLYLGAHNSDFRCQWTMRGQEDGYQEFQLQETRLDTAKRFQQLVAGKHPDYMDRVGWVPMVRQILVDAQLELSDLDGLHDGDRAAILAGREDIHGIMENKLRYIENYLDRLPTSALFGLYDALAEKLFGLPEEADAELRDIARTIEEQEA